MSLWHYAYIDGLCFSTQRSSGRFLRWSFRGTARGPASVDHVGHFSILAMLVIERDIFLLV